MSSLPYIRYELLRTFRNRRFLLLSLAFPLILYFVIAAPNRGEHNLNHTGVSAPLYYMVGLVGFGTMAAMLSTGARIAAERAVGWNRQLRLTPLSPRVYFRAKVATAYAMALVSIAALYVSGAALGVSLPAGKWVNMTELILVALIPFAALGVVMGHVLTPDSVGPATGGMIALLAFLGGTWFPITGHGFMYHLAEALPSYWLVHASHIAIGGRAWSSTGWAVMAAWTAVLILLALYAYRRDTQRV